MEQTPQIKTAEEIHRRSGYQAVQPVTRPPYWGVDLEKEKRPGRLRPRDPNPSPNPSSPPEQQQPEPAVPKHTRPNKPMPPVYGTSCPLHGVSGMVRKLAYSLPDHYP